MGRLRIIVGLGNPGRAYARHRHNLGFMVADALVAETPGAWRKDRNFGETCETELESETVLLMKPLTYMNRSGTAVGPAVARFRADPAAMIVIHDDLDLAEGQVRIKVGGGDGGHKGVRSIADSLRFRDFIRVRLGIGRPPTGVPPDEFVLTAFGPDEKDLASNLVQWGSEAVRLILTCGVQAAQNALHTTKTPAETVS